MTTRERKERRAARLQEWAASREAKADASFRKAHDLVKDIPLGQPILVGHHSEGRHRRTLQRSQDAGFAGVAHSKQAAKHASRASNIEIELERSIYSDDADAIPRLEERIAGLETEQATIKAFNAAMRKAKSDEERNDVINALPDGMRQRYISAAKFGASDPLKGFPDYKLRNLGSEIRRNKQRLDSLKRVASPGYVEAPRLLTVKYAGECRECGRSIARGETARYYRKAKELACPQDCTNDA